jgi:modulator of FtsH protease
MNQFPLTRTVASSRSLLGPVMGLVTLATAGFAAGAYLGRNAPFGLGIAGFVVAIGCTIALSMRQNDSPLDVSLLALMGAGLGVAIGPALVRYASLPNGSTVIAEAGATTTILVGVLGSYGYATRRDLAPWGRTLFFCLLGLLLFGLVGMFVAIPNGHLIYTLFGTGLFSTYVIFDFNRVQHRRGSATSLACAIFLDIVNLFLFLLQLFQGER